MKTTTRTQRRGADAPEAALALKPLLADLIALSLQAKQAHWNVTGPQFAPLHALFDELTTAFRGWYDEVAERLRALGVPADGRLTTVAEETALDEFPAGLVPGERAVTLLLDRVGTTSARARNAVTALDDIDLVTQDLVIGIVQGLEKQAWMLRAHVS